MRIPRGYVVYDKSMTPWNKLLDCLREKKDIMIIVTGEPVYLLGSFYRNGKNVLERKFMVISKNSLVLREDACGLPYIKLELDAWGEASLRNSSWVIMHELVL